MSNRGGRFVELSEYHGGTQLRSIRIPEGQRGDGWALFVTEIHKYYLEKTDSSKVPLKREGKSRVGQTLVSETQLFRNNRILHNESWQYGGVIYNWRLKSSRVILGI